MGPVERIRALGWVQNGKDARTHEAIFQHFPIISNLNLGLQKELGLWDGFRMGKTNTDGVEKQPPNGQNIDCCMRKSGKTAPK